MRQKGVGYLFVLFVVFLLALTVEKATQWNSLRTQRDREVELVEVGSAYRIAIEHYYLSAPVGQRKFPARLDDLLRDTRHAVTRRYLRQLTLDPMTSRPFVPLAAPEGGIWGVASASELKPVRVTPPPGVLVLSNPPTRYKDWAFVGSAATTP